jgi:3-oxoacyl-[acyl-carrier protein] reductase
MSDFLVELGANPTARKVIQTLGLPLPIPQKLARARGPWEIRPLADRVVVVGQAGYGALAETLSSALCEAGAVLQVIGPTGPGTSWADAAEAWGRPVRSIDVAEVVEGAPIHGLVIDATGARTVADLRALYELTHPRVRALGRCARVVVLGRPHQGAPSVEAAATRRALTGFVKSVAKEIGGKGSTANLILVEEGGEAWVPGPLRWLLMPNSAFVTAQVFRVGPSAHATDHVHFARPLDGKVALVTGAARGIGEATAATLAREGAKVLLLDRPADAEPLALAAQRCGGVPVPVDVTAPDAIARILEAAGHDRRVDIIVHNAGITRDKTLGNMDGDRWDLTIAVNLGAVLSMTEALLPHMPQGGRVIALSSVAGIAGNFGQTNYAASKAGVIGFIEGLAPIAAERGITVNGIAPGFIETRLTAAIPAATREAARRLSALAQGGQPIDIAETVTFLASPGAGGLNGNLIRVCGGALIGA